MILKFRNIPIEIFFFSDQSKDEKQITTVT